MTFRIALLGLISLWLNFMIYPGVSPAGVFNIQVTYSLIYPGVSPGGEPVFNVNELSSVDMELHRPGGYVAGIWFGGNLWWNSWQPKVNSWHPIVHQVFQTLKPFPGQSRSPPTVCLLCCKWNINLQVRIRRIQMFMEMHCLVHCQWIGRKKHIVKF